VKNAKGWSWVGDYKKLTLDNQSIILSHYCFRTWEKMHYGSWHLYGHSHGSLVDNGGGKCMDVGVDCHNFYPVPLDSVREFMEKRPISCVDGHFKIDK